MASGTLRVTPEKLEATANSFGTTADNIKNLTAQMTSIVNGLSGQVWSGDAANAYKNKFKGLEDDINRLYDMIKKQSEKLMAIAQEFKGTESNNVSEANTLSSDVII